MQWIRYQQQKPEHQQRIMFLCENGVIHLGAYYSTKIKDEYFIEFYDCDGYRYTEDDIIAWCPIDIPTIDEIKFYMTDDAINKYTTLYDPFKK